MAIFDPHDRTPMEARRESRRVYLDDLDLDLDRDGVNREVREAFRTNRYGK